MDGVSGALAAYLVLGDTNTSYYPIVYNENIMNKYQLQNATVYFIDISPDYRIIETLATTCHDIIILDHHKSAVDKLSDKASFFSEKSVLDNQKSGCMIAWEYYHPTQEPTRFFKYVEDRDIWKFQYPETKPFSLCLETFIPFTN